MSTGEARHAQNHILGYQRDLARCHCCALCWYPCVVMLQLTLLHHLQKAFDNKRLMTCFAEYARYQQLRDMPVHTDSTLRTLEKLIHRCVCLS